VDEENRTALYLACLECNVEVVQFLLERGANATIARRVDSRHEETPLGCAVRWGYTRLVSGGGGGVSPTCYTTGTCAEY